MVHKRYVMKNGKLHGPYIYHSYRDKDGKVKKRYLGKHVEISKAGVFLAIAFSFAMLFSFGMIVRIFLRFIL